MTVQEQARAVASARPEPYDFRRPATLAREHSRVLELAFETFARQWGTQLTAKVRIVSQVSCEEVTMLTYDEYAASLPATTAMVLVAVERFEAKGVIQFPVSSALGWVGHMVGGAGTVPAEERKLTQIEQALVGRLMEDALEDLRYSLGNLLTSAVRVDGFQFNSQFAQAAATADLMIVAAFDVKVGDHATRATLALPADTILPQLGDVNPMSATEDAPRLVRNQVAAAPVSLSLRLEPALVTPSAVLDLAVGDLLPIPHPRHRPLELTVEGVTLGRAAVGSNGSRLACVVVSTDS